MRAVADAGGAAAGAAVPVPWHTDPAQWTAEQVASYLTSVNLAPAHVETFLREGVNGIVFLNLTAEKLRGEPLRITQFGPRETVLGAVARVRELAEAATAAAQLPTEPPTLSATAAPWQPASPSLPPQPPAPWPVPHPAAAKPPPPGPPPSFAGDAAIAAAAALGFDWAEDGGPPVGMSFPMMPPPPMLGPMFPHLGDCGLAAAGLPLWDTFAALPLATPPAAPGEPPPAVWEPPAAAPPEARGSSLGDHIAPPQLVDSPCLSPAGSPQRGAGDAALAGRGRSPPAPAHEAPGALAAHGSPLPMLPGSPGSSGPRGQGDAAAQLSRRRAQSGDTPPSLPSDLLPAEVCSPRSDITVSSPLMEPGAWDPSAVGSPYAWRQPDPAPSAAVPMVGEFALDPGSGGGWGRADPERQGRGKRSGVQSPPAPGSAAPAVQLFGPSCDASPRSIPFVMVPSQTTDLNRPPSNWLDDDDRVAPQYNPGKLEEDSGEFAAAALMSLGAATAARPAPAAAPGEPWEGGGGDGRPVASEVDFIAPADNMKRLFMAPFTDDSDLALSIHRIGDSLVLEDGPGGREQPKREEGLMMSKLLYYSLLKQEQEMARSEPAGGQRSSSPPAESVRSMSPPPLGAHSPSAGTASTRRDAREADQTATRSPEGTEIELAPTSPSSSSSQVGEEEGAAGAAGRGALVESHAQEPEAAGGGRWEPRPFQRSLRWQFHDLNLLLGSNHLVMCQQDTGAEVMLRLHDAERPITSEDALELWLDNVMSNVPQVAICFHRDGVVQGYQMLHTNDLPSYAPERGFEPGEVQSYARSVLHWLKEKCACEAGSYLLIRDGGALRLYDLGGMFDSGALAPHAARGRLLAAGPAERLPRALRPWADEDPDSPLTPLPDDAGVVTSPSRPSLAPSAPFSFVMDPYARGMLFLRMGRGMLEQLDRSAPRSAAKALPLLLKAAELLPGTRQADGLLVTEVFCLLATAHVAATMAPPHALRTLSASPLVSPASGAGRRLRRERRLNRDARQPYVALPSRGPDQLREEERGLMDAHAALDRALKELRLHVAATGCAAEHAARAVQERVIHCRLTLATLAAAQDRFGDCLEWVARAERMIEHARRAAHTGTHRRALTDRPGAAAEAGGAGAAAGAPAGGVGGDPAWLTAAMVCLLETLGDAHQQVVAALLALPPEVAGTGPELLAPHQAALDRLLGEAQELGVAAAFLRRCDPLSPLVDRNVQRALEFYFLALQHWGRLHSPPPPPEGAVEVRRSSTPALQKKIGGMYNLLATHMLREGRLGKARECFQQAANIFAAFPDGAVNRALIALNLGKVMQRMAEAQQRGPAAELGPQEERCINQAITHYQEAVELLTTPKGAPPCALRGDAQRLSAAAQLGLAARYKQLLPQLIAGQADTDWERRTADLLLSALRGFEQHGDKREVAECHAHLGQLYKLSYQLGYDPPGASGGQGPRQERRLKLAELYLGKAERHYEGDTRGGMYLSLRAEQGRLLLAQFLGEPPGKSARREQQLRQLLRLVARCRPWLAQRRARGGGGAAAGEGGCEQAQAQGEPPEADLTEPVQQMLSLLRDTLNHATRHYLQPGQQLEGKAARHASRLRPLQQAKTAYRDALTAEATVDGLIGAIDSAAKNLLPGD
eukprot:TRINITY_DN3200_c0_g1_i2.p1 TRINITY_DN3200_c0_g1~~TRINITY_DN3200_c0_g1_i2.p1  ORF type:complete len:1640 (+),score=563.90 TRINITY_DN3200_c0_g1_i2:77-4996(+)